MNFSIVTPNGVVYEDIVEKVTIPTQDGEITILPHHTVLISVLKPGEIKIAKENYEVRLAVSSGVIQVKESGEVYVLADTAERAEDIDVERAEQARKRAEELFLEQDALADIDFARLQAKIEKEMARIQTATKYR